MTQETKDLIQKIKTDFRLAMNGVVSKSMRDKGADYKIIFGIELPRLAMIASEYEKNHELAQELWKDDVRESKIMATLLQPVDSFYPEIADIWVEGMRSTEIADIACMNLFQHLPYAADKGFIWVASENPMRQYCGWMLLARILMRRPEMNDETKAEIIDQMGAALCDADRNVRRASALCAQKYAAIGHHEAKALENALRSLRDSQDEDKRMVYQQIFA